MISEEIKEKKIETSQEEEIRALKEQLQALQQEKEKKDFDDSLNKRIDELVAKRLEQRTITERERIEEARRMIAEADKNAALEKSLLEHQKNAQVDSYKQGLLDSLKREINILAKMGKEGRHQMNLYRDYAQHQSRAARGDERAKNMLGCIELTYAAMQMGGENMVKLLKKNIGLDFDD